MIKKSDIKVMGGEDDPIQRLRNRELSKGKAEGTVNSYCFELERLDVWLKSSGSSLDRITRFDVQQYINALRAGKILKNGKKASVATTDRIFGTICVLADFLKKPQIVEDIRKPKKLPISMISPESLSRNERNKLFRDVERDGNLRNIAIVYLLSYSGLRIEELVELDRSDVEEIKQGGMLTIVGKGNKERKTPYPAEARRAVQKYLESRKDDSQALFISNYNRRLTKRSAQRVIEKYGFHAHQLRHTCFRNMLKSGWDIVEVAQFAGHKSIETTRRYTLPSQEEINEKADKIYSD
ncbi:integrase [Sporolactobacillus shoreae]|uniref:Integrase n=1 Tax=Sporolactobacillus shoreae TaxID=1465501 RepID=A0A4Z0GHQ5_9BACL|nr:tyrosine-type recombinase/integrase [Sporolactobacillus shoreae]TGA96325.1 integrase [Sporolactobacillus shoreae]